MLTTATLPTTGTVIGGGDVLLLQQAPAQQIINLWQGVTPPASTTSGAPVANLDAHTISVGVLNGSGVSHQATQAAEALRTAGFNASVSGNGSASNFGYTTSIVEYATGDQTTAQFLQSEVGGGAQLQVDTNLTAGTLLLVTGASYSGITPATPGATPTTTTTPPPAAVSAQSALDAVAGNTSNAPAFPGPHGQDPPPPGSGC
jgi:hypothetical protein